MYSEKPGSLQELSDNLAVSEALNRAVLEAAVDSIVTIDERGIIRTVNLATTKTFGFEAEELLGQNISMLMPLPFSSEHDGYLARYLVTGHRRIIGIGREVVGKRKNGSTFPMELSVSEVALPGGRLFTGILRDITYRKQVEEALLSERNRLGQYLDIAGVSIISLDSDGVIQLMNRQAAELANIPESEALGRSVNELFPQAVEFLRAVCEALSAETPKRWESTIATSFGKRVLTWHSAPLRERSGDTTGMVLSGTDITDRVRAQEQLAEAHGELEQRVANRTEQLRLANDELRDEIEERRATEERLETSLKEKEVLLKEIHHRVKNNLQLISSLLSLQMRKSRGMSPDQLLYEIQGRIQSIALLHEMLYQNGDLSSVDFAKYVETLAQTIVRYSGMSSRVTILVHAEPMKLSLDVSIYCGLLLNELITNALKHAFPNERKGTLTLEIHRAGEARVMLTVRDDGVGLKPEFDINSITSLGLELVQQLTAKLRGEMKIVQERGTEFQLSFHDGGKTQ
ncbi:MAG: PAS domain S-box protein [Bdellovibrionota bacterium]